MTIPFSEVDERGALSCVLLAGSESQPEVDELLGQLKPSLFWDSRHQVILDAMRTLRNQRHAVDLVTVSRTLMNRNGEAKGALEVLPVAGLPMQAIDHGAHLVIINQSATYINPRADVVLNDNVADIIPAIVERVLYG